MGNHYLNIPIELKFNSKFSCDEKMILAEIVTLDKLRYGCTASDLHFAKMINKSRQTTNGIIKNFERQGLLLITKEGKGKRTKLVDNFWELVISPVGIKDTLGLVEKPVEEELSDNMCRDTLQLGVENEDKTCREIDTINTINNTDILIQEEIQYTGATGDSTVENIDIQYQEACKRINELMNTDPAQLTNSFLLEFANNLAGLEKKFGYEFLVNGHIFKSNNELYKIYGSSNFYEVRKDLIYVRDNMDRFLRQKTFI